VSCIAAPQSVCLQNNRTINLLLVDLMVAYTSHYPGQFFVFFTLHAASSPFLFVFPGCHVTPRRQCPVDFFSFSWQQNATCCHHQIDCFLFFLTECCHGAVALSCAASSVQSGSTDLYGASSGSCGSQFPEAGGGRYPEGGGIRMLVAAALLQLR